MIVYIVVEEPPLEFINNFSTIIKVMGKGTDSESVQSNAQVTFIIPVSSRLRSPVGHVFCVDLIHKLN